MPHTQTISRPTILTASALLSNSPQNGAWVAVWNIAAASLNHGPRPALCGLAGIVMGTVIFVAGAATPARGQAFADLKVALVDYSKADLEPRKDCEALGKFKSKDLAQISAATVPASATVPLHCRITGTLSPEIAFEVSL